MYRGVRRSRRPGGIDAGEPIGQDGRTRYRDNCILGIDPGATTGICMVIDGKLVWGRELRSLDEVVQLIRSEASQVDLIIMEDYVGSVPGRDYYHPVTVIGAVLAIAGVLRIPIVKQVPSDQEHFRHRVKTLHRSRHVRSALSHVMHYLSGSRA